MGAGPGFALSVVRRPIRGGGGNGRAGSPREGACVMAQNNTKKEASNEASCHILLAVLNPGTDNGSRSVAPTPL